MSVPLFNDRRTQNGNRPDRYDAQKTRFFPRSTHDGTFGTMEVKTLSVDDYSHISKVSRERSTFLE